MSALVEKQCVVGAGLVSLLLLVTAGTLAKAEQMPVAPDAAQPAVLPLPGSGRF